ncbi:hypothetical protein LINPERPRIM_LOCUS19136 [Linum perenne]
MVGQQTIWRWLSGVVAANPEPTVKKIIMVLWSIWKERNDRVWNNKATIPSWIVKLGLDELADWEKARERVTPMVVDERSICRKWHPPVVGFLKCNTDAATFADTGRSGAGMIVRDHSRRTIKHRRASWAGLWNSKEAEAKAMLEALSWVETEGFRQVLFESDAEVVMKAIQRGDVDITEFGELIQGCISIMGRNPDFSVSFVRREGNGVAHVLARHSSSCVTPTVGVTSPSFIDDMLLEYCLIAHE